MTAGAVGTPKDGRGNGDGLRGSPMTASEEAVSGSMTVRERVDPPSSKQEKCLPVHGIGGRIVIKAGRGRQPKFIREIPVKEGKR